MAITHADLAPTPRGWHLGSRTGAAVMLLSILLGLLCLILCLVAEASRTRLEWKEDECSYTGSGAIPLLSGALAFVSLAAAVALQHVYLLVAVTRSESLFSDYDSVGPPPTTTWGAAGVLFVATWIAFAVGEILMLIGLSVESGHLRNWKAWRARSSCAVIGAGVFIGGGALGLSAAFLASGLHITALGMESEYRRRQMTRQQVLEAAHAAIPIPSSSPPPSVITSIQ
ncbi:hypothetical protein M569_09129, partial [Genlisea aurea]